MSAVSSRRSAARGVRRSPLSTSRLELYPVVELDGLAYAPAVAGDAMDVGEDFFTIGSDDRFGLAAVDARTGRLLPWRADLDGEDADAIVSALAVVGDRVFVGCASIRSRNSRARTSPLLLDGRGQRCCP